MDSIRGEGYEVEFVPVKALPENKLGITFKGNGVGYLEAHKIIKAITGMTGEVLVKNGLEMTVIDTPRNKPTKIEIKYKNGVSGRVNLKIFDVNSKGGATMMVQKVSGGNFAQVKSLGIDIIKHLIDEVIEGKIEEKDIENFKRKRSLKIRKTESVHRSECKKYSCDTCDKAFSTMQGLNLHNGHIHKTDRKYPCDTCKQKFNSINEVEHHKLNVHTVSESPNSKKIRIDRSVKKIKKIRIAENGVKANENEFESLMDVDLEEGLEEETEKTKLVTSKEEEVEKKRKRQMSEEKKSEKKGERKDNPKEGTGDEDERENVMEGDNGTEVNPGYMGWQNDEGEGMSNDRKFLAFQKLFNDLRSDFKHLDEKVIELEKSNANVQLLDEKVKELEKSNANQKSNLGKLNKELNSVKDEYKKCVEALRIEVEERTKAESTVKVLKEILDTKEEEKSEEENCVENMDMEIDDALGVWITQQKRKPLKITKVNSMSKKCGQCDKTFGKEKDLVNHTREHANELHECKFCGKQFDLSQMLHKHMEEHSQTTQVRCGYCNKNFSNENELATHVAEHNTNSIKCKSGNSCLKSSQESQEHLGEHSRTTPIQCGKCEEIFVNKEESAKHMEINCSNVQFKCQECDEIFDESENLNEHMKKHQKVEQFKCCKCVKAYSSMHKLRRHDWRSHRNVECNICGEQLESRDSISSHRKDVHQMVNKIRCKFFPDCLDEDECFFVHDKGTSLENQKKYYCEEGVNCKDQACEFPEREHKNTNNILCRYQSKCNMPMCRFRHVVEKPLF